MRLTWQEIQEQYPDMWVILKEMEYIQGELISAVVVFTCTDPWDINRFAEENPEINLIPTHECYTGDPVDVDVLNDDDFSISLDLEDEGGVLVGV